MNRRHLSLSLVTLALACAVASCAPSGTSEAPTPGAGPSSGAQASSAPKGSAKLGEPAPDFTLTDLDGKKVQLSQLKGKTVVLEWFNPDCPFVKANHTQGSLKGMAKRYTEKGIVWLAINSGAPGKQGHGAEVNKAGREKYGIDYPILLDESGDVGRAYGAKTTPHMYVINPEGVLVYNGAIDNTPGSEAEKGDNVVNYVDAALADLAAGKAVSTKETSPYGCSVKYASK